MIEGNSEGYLDPMVESEAKKFEEKNTQASDEVQPERNNSKSKDRMRSLINSASFAVGLIQFMGMAPGRTEAANLIEKYEDSILNNSVYSVCDQAIPKSVVQMYSKGAYRIDDDIIDKKLVDWCAQNDSAAGRKVMEFSAYNRPVFKDERDDPARLYERYQEDNIKDLNQLGKKYNIDVKILIDLENSFLRHLKVENHIGKEFSQLNRNEYVSDLSAMDVAYIIENIITKIPDQEKIPNEIRNEVIDDLTEYIVLRASQIVATPGFKTVDLKSTSLVNDNNPVH